MVLSILKGMRNEGTMDDYLRQRRDRYLILYMYVYLRDGGGERGGKQAGVR